MLDQLQAVVLIHKILYTLYHTASEVICRIFPFLFLRRGFYFFNILVSNFFHYLLFSFQNLHLFSFNLLFRLILFWRRKYKVIELLRDVLEVFLLCVNKFFKIYSKVPFFVRFLGRKILFPILAYDFNDERVKIELI